MNTTFLNQITILSDVQTDLASDKNRDIGVQTGIQLSLPQNGSVVVNDPLILPQNESAVVKEPLILESSTFRMIDDLNIDLSNILSNREEPIDYYDTERIDNTEHNINYIICNHITTKKNIYFHKSKKHNNISKYKISTEANIEGFEVKETIECDSENINIIIFKYTLQKMYKYGFNNIRGSIFDSEFNSNLEHIRLLYIYTTSFEICINCLNKNIDKDRVIKTFCRCKEKNICVFCTSDEDSINCTCREINDIEHSKLRYLDYSINHLSNHNKPSNNYQTFLDYAQSYIGMSDNVQRRLIEHKKSKMCPIFVKCKYDIENLRTPTIYDCKREDVYINELIITIIMMKTFGKHITRGGPFCSKKYSRKMIDNIDKLIYWFYKHEFSSIEDVQRHQIKLAENFIFNSALNNLRTLEIFRCNRNISVANQLRKQFITIHKDEIELSEYFTKLEQLVKDFSIKERFADQLDNSDGKIKDLHKKYECEIKYFVNILERCAKDNMELSELNNVIFKIKKYLQIYIRPKNIEVHHLSNINLYETLNIQQFRINDIYYELTYLYHRYNWVANHIQFTDTPLDCFHTILTEYKDKNIKIKIDLNERIKK